MKDNYMEELKEIKRKLLEEQTYYNGYNLMSNTDCDILMSIGARGCGKTTWWISWFILNFLMDGKQFTHMVRYKDDLKDKPVFFMDVQQLYFHNYDFKIEGDRGYIRRKKTKEWKFMCLFVSISRAKTQKGTNYPQMHNILFDEFQLDTSDKRLNRYINNEIKYFSSIVQSLKRTRPGIVVMLSNAISITNPYFSKWNICPIENKIIKKKSKYQYGDFEIETRVACESVDASNFLNVAVKSQASKIAFLCGMDSTDIGNEYINDNDNFIRKSIDYKTSFLFNLFINGKSYGVWMFTDEAYSICLYIQKKKNLESKRSYCFKNEDHNENNILIKSCNGNRDMMALKKYVAMNQCYFQNQAIKGDCYEIFSILSIY